MSDQKSSSPLSSPQMASPASSPPPASSPMSTPAKHGSVDIGTPSKTPGSTPRHRRNRVPVSKFDISKAFSGLTLGKEKPEDTTPKDNDSDDDVFVDKLNRRVNEQNMFLSGYNLNRGEVGGPAHGIAVRDFAYEQGPVFQVPTNEK